MPDRIPRSLEDRRRERPYFDARPIPPIENHYVCWFDLMGAQSAMRRSLKMTTNFVMKIHVACLEVYYKRHHDVEIFPVIDGVYILSKRQRPMLFFVKEVLSKLALTFIFEEQQLFRFLVRGAIAFGPVARGEQMVQCSNVLGDVPAYSKGIALGIPLSQAYEDEKKAAPFGIWLNESARAFAPQEDEPLQGTHWRWWSLDNSAQDNELLKFLRLAMDAYYAWAQAHPTSLLYEKQRMQEHAALFTEYVAD